MSLVVEKNNIYSLNSLHGDFKKKCFELSKDNWEKSISSFLEKINNFSSDAFDSRIVSGWFAALCEQSYFLVAHGQNFKTRHDFNKKLRRIINITCLPVILSTSGKVVCGKKQPSFLESFEPTLDRYEAMECLSEAFSGGAEAIILGGSMSYTPFFGVRGNQKENDESDIDILVIVNDVFFSQQSQKNILDCKLFPLAERKKLIRQAKIFKKLYDSNKADVLSQRFSIINKTFTVSAHFFTKAVFKKMMDTDLLGHLQKRNDFDSRLRDFRVDKFIHPCHARQTFNGERIELKITADKIGDDGYISKMPSYAVSKGKFFPGAYQTVVSPAFLVFYDKLGETKKLVENFEKFIYKEVDIQRKQHPEASYAKAHNRYEIFPPGKYDEGCNSFIFPALMHKYRSVSNIKSLTKKGENKISKQAFEKAKKVSLEWKKKIFDKAENEIASFLDKDNFNTNIDSARADGLEWYCVSSIQAEKKIKIKASSTVQSNKNEKGSFQEILFRQSIEPSEIMSLLKYEELSRRASKVYVKSNFNDKGRLLSYDIIIPIY